MIKNHQLETFRNYVGEAFKAGTATFPHYTLHGQEHLEELDRIALLLCAAIPGLRDDEAKINKLRLAIIMHDFAMVHVPDAAREQELREQLAPDLSFADIVRKTHQDEIQTIFTKEPARDAILTTFSGVSPAEIGESCTIAQHHRFHPLAEAPEHLQALCALMRLIDELEIGPKRAPLAAYKAMRPQMDLVSRFHWLKHICTRPIDSETTFNVEHAGDRVCLRFWVAVEASATTWEPLQSAILEKLQKTLASEGGARTLAERLNIKVEVSPSPASSIAGATEWLNSVVEEDLAEIEKEAFFLKFREENPPDNEKEIDEPASTGNWRCHTNLSGIRRARVQDGSDPSRSTCCDPLCVRQTDRLW